MAFQEEVKLLSDISMKLLQHLEPEPVYVKEYIEKVCEKIQKEGWLEQEGDRPWVKTFERNKFTLKVAFIHARKGEHITGADLAFELKDKKVAFVQSKRVGSGGRIHFNRFQLQKLIELEGQICGLLPLYAKIDIHEWIDITHHFYHRFEEYYGAKYPPLIPFLPFLPPYYSPFRATFYHLIMSGQSQIEERFFHTSEISFTLAGNKSLSQKELINHGLKPYEFQKMFWKCKLGGPDIQENVKKDVLYLYSLFTNRFIIWLDVEEG
ncbi:MAG: hypothetical protein AB1478_10070 [Nitrospirota bacterium]